MVNIELTKVIKAPREEVFKTVTDFENLPIRFPKYFRSMKVVGREGNVLTLEEDVVMGGRNIKQTTKHTLVPPERHEVEILSGDAAGSKIVENYKAVSEGTQVVIAADFKLAGALGGLVGFFAKGKIKGATEEVFAEFAKALEKT